MTTKLEGYTPGPWRFVKPLMVMDDHCEELVAKVECLFGRKDDAKVNARLIAAAPEMYELLFEIRRHIIDWKGQPSSLARQMDELLSRIRS